MNHDQLYPEHAKLEAIAPLSQAVGEFLEWCNGRGWQLGRYPRLSELYPDTNHPDELSHRMLPLQMPITELLAEHFGIDLDAIEYEKRAMLNAFRSMNEEPA